MIYIFSSNNSASLKRALKQNTKTPWAEVMPQIPKGHKFREDDQAYLDISGLSPAELKKALGTLKKNSAFCGIIDPKGTAGDPTAFFFDGAGDYIGPGLMKNGLSKKRFSAAFSFAAGRNSPGAASVRKTGKKAEQSGDTAGKTRAASKKKIQKLPTGKFRGWRSIRPGTTESFFFLFVSLTGKSNLRSIVGETVFNTVKNRLRELLLHNLREADALLWMETEETSLFLIPPRAANCRAAVEAALKMILNTHLISMEKLNLKVPVEFTFVLHYGETIFQAPGKTGTVISDAINYIFHLGTKKAESGRITISDDVSEEVIAEGLLNSFKPAGIFEGIPIRHTRRFIKK